MTENMIFILGSGFTSLLLGAGLGYLSFRSYRKLVVANAQEDAAEIMQEVQDELEIVKIEQQEKQAEIELELWTKVEADLLKSEEKIEDLQTEADEKKKKLDDKYSQIKSQSILHENALKEREKKVLGEQQKWNEKKKTALDLKKQYGQKMIERFSLSQKILKKKLANSLKMNANVELKKCSLIWTMI